MNKNSQSLHIKKEILINLVKAFYSDDFCKNTALIPFKMRPKNAEVPFRCCIYKEREIIKDRIIAYLGYAIEPLDETEKLEDFAQMALDRDKVPDKGHLTVIDTACKGCVPSRVYVTNLCQGCVSRACEKVCNFNAVTIEGGKSHIDGAKCRNCGLCISACPYNAIVKLIVPCEQACQVNAISKGENGTASINRESCITCGKCVSACPFGAVNEKSQIIDVLKSIKAEKKVIAMIAPAIAGQFDGTIYQLKTAMLKTGFYNVFEVAQGADITTRNEAKEFSDRMKEGKPFMTTSCCAGYNNLVRKHLQEIKPYVSETKTPLYYTAEMIKSKFPDAITVFISPCIAKRVEVAENPNIDYVLNADELDAIFLGREIEVAKLKETSFDTESSRQGRNYGITGGVSKAVSYLAQKNYKPNTCLINGINKDSIKQLKQYAQKENCPYGDLVEVMFCEGGCICGNSTVSDPKIAARNIKQLLDKSNDIEE